jgi:hypothetical protein
VKKAVKKEVEARNFFYGRKIRIGVTAVKFRTILDRKNLTAVKIGQSPTAAAAAAAAATGCPPT